MPAVIVPGESFRNIDLRQLGALPGTPFEQGSIQLFHLGADLVIGAQLYLVDEARSLSFDEKLSEFQNAASTQVESVWWLPSQESTTTLIVSNTRDVEVTADAVVQLGKGRRQQINLSLMPHETRPIVPSLPYCAILDKNFDGHLIFIKFDQSRYHRRSNRHHPTC